MDFFLILQEMHHVRIFLRKPDPIGSIGIIEQRKADPILFHDFKGVVFRLLPGLDPQTDDLTGSEKTFCRVHAVRSLIQCVIRRAGHHVEPDGGNRFPHRNRRTESWVIAVFLCILHKRSFLIYYGDITLGYGIRNILKQEVKGTSMIQAVAVYRFMDQIVAKDGE